MGGLPKITKEHRYLIILWTDVNSPQLITCSLLQGLPVIIIKIIYFLCLLQDYVRFNDNCIIWEYGAPADLIVHHIN